MVAPALEVLSELLKTRRVQLQDAAGSEEWLIISSHVHAESMGDSIGKGGIRGAGRSHVNVKREMQEPLRRNPLEDRADLALEDEDDQEELEEEEEEEDDLDEDDQEELEEE